MSEKVGSAIDPRFSPDGNWISFVQLGDVYIVRTTTPSSSKDECQPIQLTKKRNEHVVNGLSEFVR